MERDLNQFEGRGYGYQRQAIEIDYDKCEITVKDDEYKNEQAFTYIATDINDSLEPYPWYKYHVLHGAREGGFEDSYIARIKAVKAKKNICSRRVKDQLSIYSEEPGFSLSDYIDC